MDYIGLNMMWPSVVCNFSLLFFHQNDEVMREEDRLAPLHIKKATDVSIASLRASNNLPP